MRFETHTHARMHTHMYVYTYYLLSSKSKTIQVSRPTQLGLGIIVSEGTRTIPERGELAHLLAHIYGSY